MNKPKKVIRAGGVRAAIWENEMEKNGVKVPVFSVQIDRTFKKGDQFVATSRFNLADLPKVALVAQKAFEYLALNEQEEAASAESS